MDLLPPDIISLIMSYLTPPDLISCSYVSKLWYQLSGTDDIWSRFVIEILFPSTYKINYQYQAIEQTLSNIYRLSFYRDLCRDTIYKADMLNITPPYFGKLPLKMIGLLTGLVRLVIHQHSLTEQDLIHICKLDKLSQLYLYGNNITTIPPEIGNLTELLCIDLRWNNISTLPREIYTKLPRLTHLVLECNKISIIPDEIGELTSLRSLDMEQNCISVISPKIGNLKQLEYLNLKNNELEYVPDEICQLFNLCTLKLFGNKLARLPDDFTTRLTRLDKFSISNQRTNTGFVLVKMGGVETELKSGF